MCYRYIIMIRFSVIVFPFLMCISLKILKISTIDNINNANTELKDQWGWTIVTVDAEHQRNKYKNKSTAWVIFDTEEKAKTYMNLFNKMFITAIEWDAIEEYKKFKKN